MSAPWIRICDLAPYEGKTVTIKGWVYNKRSSGKIHFLQVRDGSGFIQAVMERSSVSEDLFSAAKGLWIEASVEVEGTVRRDDRAPSGYELGVTDLKIISNPTVEYPISKKEHGIDFLLDHRHLWLRSRRQRCIMSIRDRVILSCRNFLHRKGFMLVDSPILTGSIGEGADGLFELDYFDMGKAYLAQTGQLYLEAAAAAYGRVYCFGPTFRAEKSKTRRHLTEFWMIEPEAAFFEHQDNMALQEEMVSFIVKEVLEHHEKDLLFLERDVDQLAKAVDGPFHHITYDDAVKLLQKLGSDIPYGDDFGGDDETMLTQQFQRPVFVECYPKKVKAFYMKQHPEREDLVLCDDLLAPEGYGEIIGGSQREDDLELLLSSIRSHSLPEDSYSWYLDLRRYGSFPHSGFGMGIERAVAWICGLKHIREAIPWPRTIYRLNP
ncbi:asparaginyl-tRNA synthetase [Thermanaerovibrio velox DSM 12556]|uniref:Asparagine--tRNA ligase n=1 Tax=Thermanaerovibrio velox DSM 12556 TaxID=926567 RepID=H0UNC6_9BACT|nr:asparagine--tRNA ligase [Thermanaerovibrio velox]EHM09333.1 asparaginyl-tRNA synthetase [Thermanaerovibrio velox DSM 12556]